MWIRINADPDPDSGNKKSAKPWEIRIRIDRNHHNMIFLNIEITPLLNAHKLLANTKHNKSFLSIMIFMGKFLTFFSRFYVGSGSQDPLQADADPHH